MHQIRKGYTGLIIDPYTKGQCKQLENMTSTYNYVKHRYEPMTGYIVDLGDREVFATHPIYDTFLHSNFQHYQITQKRASNSENIVPFNMIADFIPTEIQQQSISKILHSPNKHSWYVNLSQGMGKTLLSVYLISIFQKKTFIMCYRKKILKQWQDTFKKMTNIDTRRVIEIDSSKIFEKICDGTFDVSKFDIYLCTPGVITSFAKRNSYNDIDTIMRTIGIGFKIYDEAHRDIRNMIMINAFSNVNRTLYLSGDKRQSNDIRTTKFKRIFQTTDFIIPDKEMTDKLRYIVGVVVKYTTDPTPLDVCGCYTKEGFSFFNFMKYQIEKDEFYEALFYTLDNIIKLNSNNNRIVILTHMIEHVDDIYEKVSSRYSHILFGKYHSGIDDEEKDNVKQNAECIISTYSSFSTGMDAANIRYVISTSPCSIIDDNQSSGRARPLSTGDDCFYFMLNDEGFEYTKEKIKARTKYLLETKLKKLVKISI